jgi:hypothetical protein
LTFLLATKDAKRSESQKLEIGRRCLKMAAKYRDKHLEYSILEIAKSASVDLKASAPQEETDSSQHDGYKALLRRDYPVAKACYRESAVRAASSNQIFEEWVWRQGELEALQGELWMLDSRRLHVPGPASSGQAEIERECGLSEKRVEALAETAEVKAWMNLAEERVRRALESALRRQATRARYRATGGEGASFGDSLYTAWQSFRDLETLCAPPALLREYLAPLLWSNDFSAGGELKVRMTLEMKETREWFTTILDSQCESIEDQQRRDVELLEAFWRVLDEQESERQRLWALGVLSGLQCGFRTPDTKRLFEWTKVLPLKVQAGPPEKRSVAAETAMPPVVNGSSGARSRLERDTRQGLGTIALWGPAAWAREIFEGVWRDGNWIEKDEIAAFSYGLPWNRWGLREPEGIVPWMEMIAGIYEDLATPQACRFDELLPFAALRMTMAVIHGRPEVLGQDVRTKLLRFADRVHSRPARGSIWWEAHRGGYLLEKELLAEPEKRGAELLRRWLNGAATAQPEDKGHVQELNWSLLADAFDDGLSNDSALVEILERHWTEIGDDVAWQPIGRHYCLNAVSAGPLIRMLSTCLVQLPNIRGAIAPRLQELLAFAPNALPHIVATLLPETWGEWWPGLVEQIVSSAGGLGRRRKTHRWMDDAGLGTLHQIGAIDLWDAHMRRIREGAAYATDGKGIRELLACLRSAAVLGVSDERAAVANHAAHAIVVAAEVVEEGEDTILLAGALRQISRDSRVAVRAAGAYAAARLPTLARSRAIRDVAVEIGIALADDPNAMVVLQHELGRLEADRASRGE